MRLVNPRSEKMRVLHVITGLGHGGAQRQLVNLVNTMDAKSSVFSILPLGVMAEEINTPKTNVYSGDLRRVVSREWVRSLSRVVGIVAPDIVVGWMYHGNLGASLTRRLGHSGPMVWNVRHSIYDLSFEKPATRWIIRGSRLLSRQPRRIIYNSQTAATQHEALGFSANHRTVLPNGFDLERFKPDSDARMKFRAEMGVSDEELLVGIIGRSHPMKNYEGWVKAFRILVNQGYAVRCVMVGAGIEAPDSKLHLAIRSAGLESEIFRLGPTPRPETVLAALDLLAMPSKWGEGFPNVVGEAMACGVPAIVTPIGDAPQVVADTGLVFDSASTDHLVAGMRAALRLGREGLVRLGKQARRRMEECYSLDSVAVMYETLLREVLRGDPKSQG
jgi:glycosyltransferase involved in cell wall biosynthesis